MCVHELPISCSAKCPSVSVSRLFDERAVTAVWHHRHSDVGILPRQPYSDAIGREYRVVGNVIAVAWNDFPDKETLLSIALSSPPGSANRFVSWTVPLKQGQVVRITGARRQFDWLGFGLWYVVSVPGMDWPEGVPVKIGIDSEGVPDPKLYELIH